MQKKGRRQRTDDVSASVDKSYVCATVDVVLAMFHLLLLRLLRWPRLQLRLRPQKEIEDEENTRRQRRSKKVAEDDNTHTVCKYCNCKEEDTERQTS